MVGGSSEISALAFARWVHSICCDDGEGSYNVTVDGTLIVEGGEFGYAERTTFFLPFVAGTNVTTQYYD